MYKSAAVYVSACHMLSGEFEALEEHSAEHRDLGVVEGKAAEG